MHASPKPCTCKQPLGNHKPGSPNLICLCCGICNEDAPNRNASAAGEYASNGPWGWEKGGGVGDAVVVTDTQVGGPIHFQCTFTNKMFGVWLEFLEFCRCCTLFYC